MFAAFRLRISKNAEKKVQPTAQLPCHSILLVSASFSKNKNKKDKLIFFD